MSDLHLLISKNKVIVELMNHKLQLDIEHDQIQKTKEDKYDSYIARFEDMNQNMASFDKKFTDMIHLLRLVKESLNVGMNINKAEIDEKLQDIFKQL
ncbi:MAG: hypothetical protein K0B07_02600 [DPANN group archaeon]|nr:hypothetical protein [DPANN group archaeon]